MATTPPNVFGAAEAVVRQADATFHNVGYTRHNARRQEHLATLGLELHGRTVLEVGAGVGDHTTFFLDRACSVLSIEARQENCQVFINSMNQQRAGLSGYLAADRVRLIRGDVLSVDRQLTESFDVVYCYGLLYHVGEPQAVLEAMARRCRDLLLLETCVSYGSEEAINPVREPSGELSQAFDGRGCRPTRPWVLSQLKRLFEYAYVPRTQPAHEEFPLDWATPPMNVPLTRAVFVASRRALSNPVFLTSLPERQVPC